MAITEAKLNQAALKLLKEYSEAEGLTPSEVVLYFVPKPKKLSRPQARKRLSQMADQISARINLSEEEIAKRLQK